MLALVIGDNTLSYVGSGFSGLSPTSALQGRVAGQLEGTTHLEQRLVLTLIACGRVGKFQTKSQQAED